ncbi:MAG: beta-glucosidase [Patescibacteria group bacterium]|nr:MAG: beta-glucosidase [Patescibacteria group bacterium]
MEFPKDFVWGASISAHQTEGNNTNSDWWKWESENKVQHLIDRSGIACDFYNRYSEDLDLCCKANLKAIRLSIEWARIEPRQGMFDTRAIDHYKKVLQAAKEKGLKTFVTLHHFTNPLWFSEIGGWTNLKAPLLFSNYAKKCAETLNDYVDFFITINEPKIYSSMAYLHGVWPPCKKSLLLATWVQIIMAKSHNLAYKKIKSVVGKPVGIVKNISWYEYSSFTPLDKVIAKIHFFLKGALFLNPVAKYSDFIGLNYYFTNRIVKFRIKNPDSPVNDLGWWINYEGLYNVLLSLKKYDLPIFITENGIADSADKYRAGFIKKMLSQVHLAILRGVKVRGYFYWSLLDNYEWHHGFAPKFGLVYVDREHNLKRIPRKSFYVYAEICKNGVVG